MSSSSTQQPRRLLYRLAVSPRLPGAVLLGLALPLAVAVQGQPAVPDPSPVPVNSSTFQGQLEAETAEVVKPPAADRRQVEVVKAVFAPPGHREVEELRLWRRGGGRVDWSLQGTQIAWDQAGEDGLYDLWVSDIDGGTERCLTCDNFDWRKVNVFNPTWHPSGDLLVVQVQDVARKLKMAPVPLATAHRGLHSEFWAFTADGKRYWRLTRFDTLGHAALDPKFSNEGSRLLWTERLTTKGGRWGRWAVGLADFNIKRGVPRLGKPHTYQPFSAAGLLFADTFTPDDRALLISAGTHPGTDDLVVFKYSPEDGELRQLSPRGRGTDSSARFGPRGQRIVWASSRGIGSPPWSTRLPWHNDLWRMDADGSHQERLTYFNDPDGDFYLGEALIDDLAWDPRGQGLLVHVVNAGLNGGEQAEEDLYLLRFAGEPQRP